MNVCKDVFGKYAFRKYNKDFRHGPINKAIFEIWAICFSELTNEQLEKIKTDKDRFIEGFRDILESAEFATALKAGDQYSLIKRVDTCRKFVKEFYA